LFPQDKEDFGSVTSHEENWFVFSRSQRSSAPNNHRIKYSNNKDQITAQPAEEKYEDSWGN